MTEVLKDKQKQKISPPSKFEVVLLNDDYSTMDFVVEVIRIFFNKDKIASKKLMLTIHMSGEAVCGVYSFDVANTKVNQVISYARKNSQPLMCIMRECNK